MLIDLSHSIEHGMVTYAGLPGPVISDFLSREASRSRYAEGTEFQIGRIDMVANTGTYIDSPFHRFPDGGDLSTISLEAVAGVPAVVLPAHGRSIDAASLSDLDLRGKALLIHTGWSRHWRTETYFNNQHPFVSGEAAEKIAASGARVVGIDSYNIDATDGGTRPAHTALLRAGIFIVEHLTNLESLPQSGELRFFAVPPKVRGLGTFPVRAFAMV
jgi:arylformamidase